MRAFYIENFEGYPARALEISRNFRERVGCTGVWWISLWSRLDRPLLGRETIFKYSDFPKIALKPISVVPHFGFAASVFDGSRDPGVIDRWR